MSDQQMDDYYERRQLEWIASELRVDPDELSQHEYEVHENTSDDGLVYGHYVEFDAETDPEFIKRVGDHTVYIGFPPEEPGPDDE